jgi:glycosyltransferase involved in cell wall biosynthesis
MSEQNGKKNGVLNIAFVSSYLPRKCGVATFTYALKNTLEKKYGDQIKSTIVAITDPHKSYDYKEDVKCVIKQKDEKTYKEAADFINNSKAQVVNLQHEFGLFGTVGEDDGKNILGFLKCLQKQKLVITTFHMVYPDPDKHHKKIVQEICKLSHKAVVIVEAAYATLIKDYEIPEEKIIIIPHGVPNIKRRGSKYYKELLKLPADYNILSTFGLIRAKKGIEYAIRAMPRILEKHPKTLYLVLGAVHPNRPKEYYYSLKDEVEKLGLKDNVRFLGRFLEYDELMNYLMATNIFIAPYLVLEQVSSGALIYAMGCGRASVATPFIFAKEVLAEGRGVIIPEKDSDAIAKNVIKLLSDNDKRHAIENAAYKYARDRLWRKIASMYFHLFKDILNNK